MSCPGSVRMVRGIPNVETSHAREGTRAHALAELALRRGVPCSTFIGMELEGGVVTDDMAEAVQVYVDHCAGFVAFGHPETRFIERRFNLAALNPPGPMFGTADFVWVDRVENKMGIVDLKYGQGVLVEVEDNPQLLYYALGALLTFPGFTPDEVVATIVQPRALHPDGPVRSATYTFEQLMDFAGELLAAARRTTDPGAPLKAGSWCRFCPAAAQCPEKHAEAERVAMVEFSAMDLSPAHVPPDPRLVPIETIAAWLPHFDTLEQWMKDCRAIVEVKLRAGEHVPGWKLVNKRATRSWGDAETAEQLLKAEKYDEDEIYEPRKLKSPAQIEKVTGKKEFKATMEQFVVKQSSGTKMVPESDPAPAVVVTRGEEFAITAGDAEE